MVAAGNGPSIANQRQLQYVTWKGKKWRVNNYFGSRNCTSRPWSAICISWEFIFSEQNTDFRFLYKIWILLFVYNYYYSTNTFFGKTCAFNKFQAKKSEICEKLTMFNWTFKIRYLRSVQRCVLCRSRRELSQDYLLAKIGVDTAEDLPLQVWRRLNSFIHLPR